jgi:alpha-glucosidase
MILTRGVDGQARNHYADGKQPQEAYVWPTVAEASRRAISIRYSLLPYLYTLFHYAHIKGDTIMRALAWEFPDDITIRETDNQFLVGSSVLITPVLEQGATTVKGVFPGIGDGTRWYDWYTLQEVNNVSSEENATMSAPLEHINVHVRGGAILPLQQPANTTAQNRENPFSLLVALDDHEHAAGSLYLDDGESIHPQATKMVDVS